MKHLTKYGNPLHSGGPNVEWPSVATIRSQAGLKSGLSVLSPKVPSGTARYRRQNLVRESVRPRLLYAGERGSVAFFAL